MLGLGLACEVSLRRRVLVMRMYLLLAVENLKNDRRCS